MITKPSAGLLGLALILAAVPARADIQPAELVAGSISLTGSYVVANIYVGGTYGQTYPAGRTATLEYRAGSGPWQVLAAERLPAIGTQGYYLTRPFASPVKVTTTFRLRISGSDRNPGNDVVTRTFYAYAVILDPAARSRIILRKDNDLEKKAKLKVRIIPK